MPKQNRPLVRDGRLQAPKRRTDRSYLRPEHERDPLVPESQEFAETPETVIETDIAMAMAEMRASGAGPQGARYANRPPAARALQQQGVRKRREVDVDALATRDTNYALHEVRRIAVLAAMVIVTLIVLGIVLR